MPRAGECHSEVGHLFSETITISMQVEVGIACVPLCAKEHVVLAAGLHRNARLLKQRGLARCASVFLRLAATAAVDHALRGAADAQAADYVRRLRSTTHAQPAGCH